jgi:plastocyanin
MLGGGETGSVTFKIPEKKGEYEYVCTFRAHYQAGMKGKLIVE